MADGYDYSQKEIFVNKKMLSGRVKLRDSDFDALKVDYNEQEKGIPIFQLLWALREHYYLTKNIIGSDKDMDAAKLDFDTRQEKLLRERIKNQELLLELIPKEEAANRSLEMIRGFNSILKRLLRELAYDQPGDTRENEENFTKKFNELFREVVEAEGKIIEWFEDGSRTLLETRLLGKSKVKTLAQPFDKELEEFVKNNTKPKRELFLDNEEDKDKKGKNDKEEK